MITIAIILSTELETPISMVLPVKQWIVRPGYTLAENLWDAMASSTREWLDITSFYQNSLFVVSQLFGVGLARASLGGGTANQHLTHKFTACQSSTCFAS